MSGVSDFLGIERDTKLVGGICALYFWSLSRTSVCKFEAVITIINSWEYITWRVQQLNNQRPTPKWSTQKNDKAFVVDDFSGFYLWVGDSGWIAETHWNIQTTNQPLPSGGFLQWWYPTTMAFPTKNDHIGVLWGYHHLRKHPSAKLTQQWKITKFNTHTHTQNIDTWSIFHHHFEHVTEM